jgi:hypothetical protein
MCGVHDAYKNVVLAGGGGVINFRDRNPYESINIRVQCACERAVELNDQPKNYVGIRRKIFFFKHSSSRSIYARFQPRPYSTMRQRFAPGISRLFFFELKIFHHHQFCLLDQHTFFVRLNIILIVIAHKPIKHNISTYECNRLLCSIVI